MPREAGEIAMGVAGKPRRNRWPWALALSLGRAAGVTRSPWGAWLVVASMVVVGCTRPNPDYEAPNGQDCEPGDRRCEGLLVLVCVAVTDADPAWGIERSCPADAPCTAGQCQPVALRACSLGCSSDEECTVFVDTAGTGLELLCASPVGTGGGMESCADGRDCRSGLCMAIRGERLCFLACRQERGSPLCPPEQQCRDLTLTIDGVQDTIRGCIPGGII